MSKQTIDIIAPIIEEMESRFPERVIAERVIEAYERSVIDALPGFGWGALFFGCPCGWSGRVLIAAGPSASPARCPNCGRIGP